jgi:transposase
LALRLNRLRVFFQSPNRSADRAKEFRCGSGRAPLRLFEHLAAEPDNEYAMIDSAIVRAHQHSAGAPQEIGRSKGGLSTKIHALVDALGNPLRFLLTPGQAHDLIGTDALLSQMAAEVLIADKAYDADDRVLKPLARAGKSAVIPPRQNRTAPHQFDEGSTRHATNREFLPQTQTIPRHR